MTFEKFKMFITEHTGLVFTEERTWQRGNLNLTLEEMTLLESDFDRSKAAILENQSGKDRVVQTMIRVLNNKSGVTWGSTGHTGTPVPTAAWGPQAEQIIQNIRDNTDIGKQLKMTISPMSVP